MPDDLDKETMNDTSAMEQYREAKAQAEQYLTDATINEAFELGFWKGRLAGIDFTIQSTKDALDPQLVAECEAAVAPL